MTESEIKLIATDLDGTLVHNKKMSPRDRRTLERLLSKGIPVVPATTRMRFSSSEILKNTNIFDHPVVCMNGARVVGPRWDQHDDHEDWMVTHLDESTAGAVSSFADENSYELTTVFSERKYWRKRRDQSVGPHLKEPITYLVNNNIDALEDGPPISFMMHKERNGSEGLRDMEIYVKENHGKKTITHRHNYLGEWVALTIYPYQISKLKALELVCENMDIGLENVLAIGNDYVDLDMIKGCGIGVAMENSPDEVKEAADFVSSSCLDNGFSCAVEHYGL
ncbi:MAG: HAD-IIB family hydrolase [Thermoplasmata archaeon]